MESDTRYILKAWRTDRPFAGVIVSDHLSVEAAKTAAYDWAGPVIGLIPAAELRLSIDVGGCAVTVGHVVANDRLTPHGVSRAYIAWQDAF